MDGETKNYEEKLIRDFKNGSHERFDELVTAYGEKLYRLSYGLLGNHHDAEEVVQDAFVRAYNALAFPEDRISDEDIKYIVENEKIPAHLCCKDPDPAFGSHTVLLRKQSANVRLTLFEGAHDILPMVSGDWFARQCSGRKPDWGNGTALSDDATRLTH